MSAQNSTTTGAADNRSLYFDVSTYRLPTFIAVTTYTGFVLAIPAALLNLLLLVTFIRNPKLITPFTIHIVSLTIINVITAVAADPILLLHNMSREFFRGNPNLCATYKFTQWSTGSLCALQHLIICLDRWLAVLCPVWYRTKTVTFGIVLTVSALIYQQLWFLPLFITDRQIPVPGDRLCDFTQAYPVYQQIARSAILSLPQCTLFVAYPILLYKIFSRKYLFSTQITETNPQLPLVQSVTTGSNPDGERTVKAVASTSSGTAFDVPRSKTTTSLPPAMVRIAAKKSRSELHLALCLVVCQMIFWTPMTILTIMGNARLSLRYQIDVSVFGYTLPIVVVLADPIFNLIFLRKLRMAVLSQFRWRKSYVTGVTPLSG